MTEIMSGSDKECRHTVPLAEEESRLAVLLSFSDQSLLRFFGVPNRPGCPQVRQLFGDTKADVLDVIAVRPKGGLACMQKGAYDERQKTGST